MKISDSLKRFRENYGYSRKDVASKIGILPQSYYKYETAQNIPSAELIVKIADSFNVSTDYLLGLIDTPRPLSGIDSSNEVIQAAIDCQNAFKNLNQAIEKHKTIIMTSE